MSATRYRFPLALGLILLSLPVLCAAAQLTVPRNLRQLSLEDLMSIEITAASRKEQRAADVAAGIFVITQEDIRRSGMTSIPDVLRMAPGVDVARISASKWAVSVRGFNSVYADKLLVLIDGRTLYDRIFSGVVWDTQDLMLDDVDRIEVIRGPGAAMWGANAVNAVINIVTRPATGTPGGLVRVDGGGPGAQAAVRYGGSLGTTGTAGYRVYAQWTDLDETLTAPKTPAGDAGRSVTAGFRTDWSPESSPGHPNAVTLEGAFTAAHTRALWANLDSRTVATEPFSHGVTDAYLGHLLGRWTRAQADGASLQVQSFVDLSNRRAPMGTYDRQTVDVDTQYHKPLGARHDLVAGAGYRFIADQSTGIVGISLTPADEQSSLVTGFVQDEIAVLRHRLSVTLGSQVQYDSESGGGIEPTARVMWKGFQHQHLWAAASRALRTPSRYERGIDIEYPPSVTPAGLPLFVSITGNPDVRTETLADFEAGYRVEATNRFSIDVTGFAARYRHLRTTERLGPIFLPGPPPQVRGTSQFANSLDASTRGVEFAGHWTPVPIWRVDGSYTAFHLEPDPSATTRDPKAATADGSAPRGQWQVRSSLTLGKRATVTGALFHVGRLEQLNIAAYTRADLTAEFPLTRHLSVMAIGQNLLDPLHAEFALAESLMLATQIPRGASARLRWTF
jgi:iron complex outermembrane recepter protein